MDLRLPALYDLRSDPFERANHESIGYPMWRIERVYLLVPAQVFVANWLASFSLDQITQKIQEAAGAGR